MGSFKDYLQKRLINEMGYMILPNRTAIQMGHGDEPIPVKMFDMKFELYMPEMGQHSPFVAKIPGTSRSYLVWDCDIPRIVKMGEEEVQSQLGKEVVILGKPRKYTMLPDNWFQYAEPVE